MTHSEIIKRLCSDSQISQRELADEIGMKNGNFSRALKGELRLSTFVRMVEAAGAQLIVQTETDDFIVELS